MLKTTGFVALFLHFNIIVPFGSEKDCTFVSHEIKISS